MGKGTVPDKKDDDEKVKLKPIPEKQVNFINAVKLQKKIRNFNYDIKNFSFTDG